MIELHTEQLLSPRDAARHLGCTPLRVVQLANEGKLRAIVDSSGKRTFPVEDVERLARERQARKAGRK